MRRTALFRIAAITLVAVLATGSGPAGAQLSRAAHAQRAAAQTMGTQPRTWHVIAGFSQVLPTGNDSTQVVNQFYPRTLTIYQGDRVTWTINARGEVHTVTFGPDPVLRKLEDPNQQVIPTKMGGKTVFVANPAVFFPSARGPLVESDAGSARHLLNCGKIGPIGAPVPMVWAAARWAWAARESCAP